MERVELNSPVCKAKYVVYGKFLEEWPLDPVCHGCPDPKEDKWTEEAIAILGDSLKNYGSYIRDNTGKYEIRLPALQSHLYRMPVGGEDCDARIFIKPGFEDPSGEGRRSFSSIFAEVKSGNVSEELVPLEQVSRMENLAKDLVKPVSTSYYRSRNIDPLTPFCVKCIGVQVPKGQIIEKSVTETTLQNLLGDFEDVYGRSETDKHSFGCINTSKNHFLSLAGLGINNLPILEWAGMTDMADVDDLSDFMLSLGPVRGLVSDNRLPVGNKYLGIDQSKL